MFSWDLLGRRVRGWFSGAGGRALAGGLAAMVLVFAVYSPSLGHDYCAVDDAYFVLENPVVQGGLTWAGIKAAWTTVHASYWAPLLWMSFMLDQEISGGAPWSFHLTNILLFAASSGLLYALVRRWTGRNGIAFATTLLWALHPARVESVAWITERKDVLSGLFFLLGLWFYTASRQSGNPAAATRDLARPATGNLQPAILVICSWLCMLLGGMAKQIVIVMPVALILLDVWPLGRTSWSRLGRGVWKLAAEKWAFWILAIAFAGLPIWTHVREDALVDMSLGHRLAMIPIHYLFYVHKLFWPSELAPLQGDLPLVGWKLAAGVGLLAGATALAWRLRVRAPWILWGWLWFAGLLFPLSGVMWAGSERIAVRWMYLPQIGLTLAAGLAVEAFSRRRESAKRWVRIGCAGILLVSGDLTLRTLWHWRDPDSFGLWIWECHPQQSGACAMGGDVYRAQGRWAEAIATYERGVEMGDKYCLIRLMMVWNYLGHMDRSLKEWDAYSNSLNLPLEQFDEWERPLERVLLWRVRGQMLLSQGDFDGAMAAFKEAVRWESDSGAFVLAEYLRACHEGGRAEEGAETAKRMAVATGIRVREWRDLLPIYVQMWKMGARGYAYVYFVNYAERFPDDAVNLNYMAWLLATAPPDGLDHARMDEWPKAATKWAQQALESSSDTPAGVWQVLAAARANAGDSSGAVCAAEKARDLAEEQSDDALVEQIEKQILTYRMGLAWRE